MDLDGCRHQNRTTYFDYRCQDHDFGVRALVILNVLLVVGTVLAQWMTSLRREELRRVTYERVALILPERRPELLADLSARLGVLVVRVEVGDVDFVRDTAQLSVWYRPKAQREDQHHPTAMEALRE